MIRGGKTMKQIGVKISTWFATINLREIFTTLLEICAVGAIAYGVNINWGIGWGLIVGGVFALVMSFLFSFEPNPERGNE